MSDSEVGVLGGAVQTRTRSDSNVHELSVK